MPTDPNTMTTPPPVTRAHREAASNIVTSWFGEGGTLHSEKLDERIAQALASAEHRGRTEAEEGGKGWVACEERMPEADENVMIFDDCHEFGIAYRREDGTWKEDLSGLEFRAEQITHWRPLPPPPPGDR